MSSRKRKRAAPERFAPEDFVATKQQRVAAASVAAKKAAPRATATTARPAARPRTVKVTAARPPPIKAKRKTKKASPANLVDATGGAAAYVEDAKRLAIAFSKTGHKAMRLTSVAVLPHSRHADVYEEKARGLAATQVPLLSRDVEPEVRDVRVEARLSTETGFAREVLAFHGTPSCNVQSIVKDGFRPGRVGMRGGAVYTSCLASYSDNYTGWQLTPRPKTGGKKLPPRRLTLIGCRVLAYAGETWSSMHAVIEPARVLPVCLLHYARHK